MEGPVYVPHRTVFPTKEIKELHLDSQLLDMPEDDESKARNLCREEYDSYAGYKSVQEIILNEARDDIRFLHETTDALERIKEYAVVSPLLDEEHLSIKDETVQPTKSFKIRGAANFILKHLVNSGEDTVITASAGNHGQGVALVTHKLGLKSIIVVPEGTPQTKLDGIEQYGGHVIKHGSTYQEASRYAQELQNGRGAVYVPAYNHRDIMAGQATIALELLEKKPDTTDIVVPAGGLGLLAGVARYTHAARPDVKVWGSAVEDKSSALASFAARTVVHSEVDPLADGIAVNEVGDETFAVSYRTAAGILPVSHDRLRQTVARLAQAEHLAEPAGAIAVAAVLSHFRAGRRPVAVLTGANIDNSTLAYCLESLQPREA